jgi:hypothetical protein
MKLFKSSDASILDRPSVDQFLRQHQSMLFDRQYHSTLPELVYKFLLELHNSKVPLKQWPLQIGKFCFYCKNIIRPNTYYTEMAYWVNAQLTNTLTSQIDSKGFPRM